LNKKAAAQFLEQPLPRSSPARLPREEDTGFAEETLFQSNLFIVVVSQMLDY
jgi:hypothetical protein